MKWDSFALSDIGRVRKSNQDAVGSFPEIGLFLLADGMGGLDLGDRASRLTIETIAEHWRRSLDAATSASTELMVRAIDLANERIREEAALESSRRRGSVRLGTTLVALWLENVSASAHWMHLGDSRLYRVRGGLLELLTTDHTLVGAALPREERVPLDLPHTNLLTHALGLNESAPAVGGKATLAPGDTFLLCSDGVSGALEAQELLTRLESPDTTEIIARGLIESALVRDGEDNASVVVVRASDS